MWPWGQPPPSSSPPYQSPAYSLPYVQHMPAVPSMPISHLSSNLPGMGTAQLVTNPGGFPTSQSTGTHYPQLSLSESTHANGVAYSGGLIMETPQASAPGSPWIGRGPQIGSSSIQTQSASSIPENNSQSPVQNSSLNSTLSSQHSNDRLSYPPQGPSVSQIGHPRRSAIDNSSLQSAHLIPFQSSTSSAIHVGGFRQQAVVSPEVHTPAFQTPLQRLSSNSTAYQRDVDSLDSPSSFQQIQNVRERSPSDTVYSHPHQPTPVIGVSHSLVRDIVDRNLDSSHVHPQQAEPRPFTVDFLLRDRPQMGVMGDIPAVGYSSSQRGFAPQSDLYHHQSITSSQSDPLSLIRYGSDSPSQVDCQPPLAFDSLPSSNQEQQEQSSPEHNTMSERQSSPPELIPSQTDSQDGYVSTTQCDESSPNRSSLPGTNPSSVSKNSHTGHVTSTDHVTFDGKIISRSSSKSSLNDTGTSLVICEGKNERNPSITERDTTKNNIKLRPFLIAPIPKDDCQQNSYSGRDKLEPPVQQTSPTVNPTNMSADPTNLSAADKGDRQPDTKSNISLIQPPSANQGTASQETVSQKVATLETASQEMASQGTVSQGTASQETVSQGTASQETVSQGTASQETVSQETASRGTASKDKKSMFTTSNIAAMMSPLIRHQHNESSDDDDVFLPNPVTDICSKVEPNIAMETEGEAMEDALTTGTRDELETGHREKEVNLNVIEKQSSSTIAEKIASGIHPPVVIKRGRGTAKTLDMKKLQLPLTQGWQRLVRKRIGADQVRVDICYVSPGGRRLRTFPEIQNHLQLSASSHLTLDHFTFSKKVELGEVQDQNTVDSSPRGSRKRGRGSRRGTRGGSLPKLNHIDVEPQFPMPGFEEPRSSTSNENTTPKSRGRGRGRGGRGRGRGGKGLERSRKVGESSKAVRGEKSQLATHSTRALLPAVGPGPDPSHQPSTVLDGSNQQITAVSRSAAVALITKAIRETNTQSNPTESNSPAGVDLGGKQLLAQSDLLVDQHNLPGSVNQNDGTEHVQKSPPVFGSAGDVHMADGSEPNDDGLAVLSSTAISTQVLSTTTRVAPKDEFKIDLPTPSNKLATSSRGRGKSGGRGHGRKRKSEQTNPIPPPKRQRGRPRGNGVRAVDSRSTMNEIPQRKKRGRKPKSILPNTTRTTRGPLVTSPADGVVNRGASPSMTLPPRVIVRQSGALVSQTPKQVQDEKRRQLLLKARADKAKKKEVRHLQRSFMVNQRKLAQRQRRERERILMKQARDKLEKLTRQREAEDREVRRQCAAKQKEVDNQRKARERTLRLIAHLKQQELERNRRIYQQQLEMEKARQLKRPVEDLEVRESTSLPTLASLGWVKLPSQSFADLLVVVEFACSFSEFLELDSRIPSLTDVYLALFNYKKGKALLDVCMQLFKAAAYDQGTRAVTESGNRLVDVPVTPLTLSELLRLYLEEYSDHSMDSIAQALGTFPVQYLRPSQKIQLLKFLVGELLDSSSLMREVDTRMEQIASLRREKWKISLKMKKFRSRLSSVYGVGDSTRPITYTGRGRPPKRAVMTTLHGPLGEGQNAHEPGDSSDEGDEPGQTNTNEEVEAVASESEYSEEETDEEVPGEKDELLSRLKCLKKKFAFVRNRIHNTSRLMRKFPLGQDRYARQYWVLPSMGGVMVEGVETSLDKNLQVNLDFVDMSTVGPKGVVQSAGSVEDVQLRVIDSKTANSFTITKEDQSNQLTEDDEKMASSSLVCSQHNTSTGINELQVIYEEGDHRNHYTIPKSHVITDDDVRDIHSSSKTTTPIVFFDSTEVTSVGTPLSNFKGNSFAQMSIESSSSRRAQASPLQTTTKQEANKRHNVVAQSSKQLEITSITPSREVKSASSETVEQGGNIDADTHSIPVLLNNHPSPRQTHIGMQHTDILLDRDLSSPPPLTSIIQESPEANTEPPYNTQLHASLSCSESLGEEDGTRDFGKDSQQDQEPLATGQSPIERTGTVHSHWETNTHQTSIESAKPWFSIGPRHPCETSPQQLGNPQLVYANSQAVIANDLLQQQQVVSGGSSQQQQYVMATPTAQYAYMTPDGQVVAAPGGQAVVPQLGVGYRLVGNTLVQVPPTQYVAMDSTGGIIGNFVGQQTPSVQYAVTQTDGGAQYVVMAGDPGGAGYISVGGTASKPALVQTVNQDGEQVLAQVIQDEQGQVLVPLNQGAEQQYMVSVANGQNPQAQVGVASQGQVDVAYINNRARTKTDDKSVVKVESESPTSTPIDSLPRPTVMEVNSDESDCKDKLYVGTYRPTSSDVSTVGGQNDRVTNSFVVKDGTYIQQGNSSHVTAVSSDMVNLSITSPPRRTLSTDDTQASPQFVTAVVPGGPDGAPRYVSLPADPRVLSGQCSYAVLQQPDGAQQIVLVDNNSVVTYPENGTDSSSSTSVVSMELPPPTLMDNDSEAESSVAAITLMYAQQPLPFLDSTAEQVDGDKEKNLRELLEEQDIDLTHGWWSITRPEIIDKLLKTFCTRGVREKCLAKSIQKNKGNITNIIDPSIMTSFESSFLLLSKQISGIDGNSSQTLSSDVAMDTTETDHSRVAIDTTDTNHHVAIDTTETDHSHVSDGVDLDMSTEEVRSESVSTSDTADTPHTPVDTNENSEDGGLKDDEEPTNQNQANLSCEVTEPEGSNPIFPMFCVDSLLMVVEYLEGMQKRLFTAKLHNEGVTHWDSIYPEVKVQGHTPVSFSLISDGLLQLESCIDRVHFKPPLRDRKLFKEEQERQKETTSKARPGNRRDRAPLTVRRDSSLLELPSDNLLSWRRAVEKAMSASQFAVCMSELEVCVAWEKSNYIVFCQVCHGGENESLLLLCDGCDRGTHTYCCKPKLSIVPEGDWYCYDCVTSNSKYRPCYVCDSKRGVLLSCAVCPRNYHKRCLNPPLNKLPNCPWKCPTCKDKPIPQSRPKNSPHSKKREKANKGDDSICMTLLKDMEALDDSWPFLVPVEKRKFPGYYRVVKKPVDFQTMKTKLEEGRYKEDIDLFATDARQVFSNCAFYNEDNSEIGIAGHNMSAFFEKRWAKLTNHT